MEDRGPLPRPSMPDGIEFELQGDVSLEEFERAIKALKNLLEGLAGQVAQGASVRWVVEDLAAGSAYAALLPEIDTPESDRIIEAYGEVGEALEQHRGLPYLPVTKGPVNVLRRLMQQGPVEAVVFGAKGIRSTFEDIDAKAVRGRTAYTEAYGAVLGFLRSLTMPQKGLRAAITDARGRSIRCFFAEDKEEELREFWGEFVAVEGLVKRRMATGDPVSISKITSIEKREQYAPGAWRDAVGIVSVPEGTEPSEDTVRRLRDA